MSFTFASPSYCAMFCGPNRCVPTSSWMINEERREGKEGGEGEQGRTEYVGQLLFAPREKTAAKRGIWRGRSILLSPLCSPGITDQTVLSVCDGAPRGLAGVSVNFFLYIPNVAQPLVLPSPPEPVAAPDAVVAATATAIPASPPADAMADPDSANIAPDPAALPATATADRAADANDGVSSSAETVSVATPASAPADPTPPVSPEVPAAVEPPPASTPIDPADASKTSLATAADPAADAKSPPTAIQTAPVTPAPPEHPAVAWPVPHQAYKEAYIELGKLTVAPAMTTRNVIETLLAQSVSKHPMVGARHVKAGEGREGAEKERKENPWEYIRVRVPPETRESLRIPMYASRNSYLGSQGTGNRRKGRWGYSSPPSPFPMLPRGVGRGVRFRESTTP